MPVPVETVAACPSCQSLGTRHWCFGSDLLLDTTSQRFEYRICTECRVIFLGTRPSGSAALDRIYPASYRPHQRSARDNQPGSSRLTLPKRLERRILGAARREFKRRVGSYYAKIRPDSVFLDFGCGAGEYLDRMKKLGCRTVGMDFSAPLLERIQSHGHRAVPVTELGWSSLAPGSVDFVRANHVFEHLFTIEETLAMLFSRLKRGGVIHIALPNPEGLSALLFRRYWHGLDCPRHAVLYPSSTLTRLLKRAGYTVREIVSEPLTKDHIRSWAYLLRSLGLTSRQSPDQYVDKPLLRCLAAIPAAAGLKLNRPDRFHVIAVKDGDSE